MQLLKFSAHWCAPCKAMSAELTKYPAVTVTEVDIEENPAAKAQWGLRSVPTLVMLDETGEEVNRLVGFSSSKLKEFLTVGT